MATDESIAFMGAAKPSAEAKANEVVEAAEQALGVDITHVWGYDPNEGNEEHHSGLAADIMLYEGKGINTALGNWVANYLLANRTRLGVRWVIWNHQIYNVAKGYWRRMEDRGNPTANHEDHVHVLFTNSPYVAPGKTVVVKSVKPASAVPAALKKRPRLTVDGGLGEQTIREWQHINGTPEDGEISTYSSLVRAVQMFLRKKGMVGLDGRPLSIDGRGVASNIGRRVGPTNTIAALQRYYKTPVDGYMDADDSSLVRAIQTAINKQNGY